MHDRIRRDFYRTHNASDIYAAVKDCRSCARNSQMNNKNEEGLDYLHLPDHERMCPWTYWSFVKQKTQKRIQLPDN